METYIIEYFVVLNEIRKATHKRHTTQIGTTYDVTQHTLNEMFT